VPTRHRNHNGYLLLWDGLGVLFDPGEGTQRQMERFGVASSQIHHIAITHFHGDHCLGLPGLVQRLHGDRVAHGATVSFPASGQHFFDNLLDACAYDRTVPIVPRPVEGDEPVVLQLRPGLRLLARRLNHRIDTWGYRVEEADGLSFDAERLRAAGVHGPDVGRLLRHGHVQIGGRAVHLADVTEPRPGQVFAFVMDTRPCPAAVELARDADLLVIESTFRAKDAESAVRYGHLTATEAAHIAVEAGARRVALAHFSRRYPDDGGFAAEAVAIHPHVQEVRDGDRLTFPSRRLPSVDLVLQSSRSGPMDPT
jgi:ribonuclease Z